MPEIRPGMVLYDVYDHDIVLVLYVNGENVGIKHTVHGYRIPCHHSKDSLVMLIYNSRLLVVTDGI